MLEGDGKQSPPLPIVESLLAVLAVPLVVIGIGSGSNRENIAFESTVPPFRSPWGKGDCYA